MSNDKYFLYHQQGVVKVISKAALPEVCFDYGEQLQKALLTKGITVENAILGKVYGSPKFYNILTDDILPYAIIDNAEENHLYELPEGLAVEKK